MDIVSFYLTEDALHWWDWISKEDPIRTWAEFEKHLHMQFGNPYEDASGKFTKLRQETTMKDYLGQFERLSNKSSGLNESFRVGTFISGLKEELCFKVKRDHPQTMIEAIRQALAMEEEMIYFHKKSDPFSDAHGE